MLLFYNGPVGLRRVGHHSRQVNIMQLDPLLFSHAGQGNQVRDQVAEPGRLLANRLGPLIFSLHHLKQFRVGGDNRDRGL